MKKAHRVITLTGRLFERCLTSPLSYRSHARDGSVDHLADDIDETRTRNSISQPPTAHAVRFAERIGSHDLIQHPGLSKQSVMLAFPDHMAVRLVAKDSDVTASDQVR